MRLTSNTFKNSQKEYLMEYIIGKREREKGIPYGER